MTLSLLFGGVATLLLLSSLFDWYLQRLPDAPWCPGCRSLTRGDDALNALAYLLPSLASTAVRECGSCGWRGRMRLRFAPEGARRG